MRKEIVLALTLVGGALVPVVAQDRPQPPVPSTPPVATNPLAPPGAGRQIPLRVQLTLSRYQGEKKISSTPYVLGVLTNNQKTSLRMGVQVPVVTTVFGAKDAGGLATIPQSSYTYRDVGTNIDCNAQDTGNGLFTLTITVEDSTIQLDRPEPSQPKDEKRTLGDIPAFRSFRASFAMVLRDGQTMQYASATDPISGEVVRVDVNLTMAK
jgi:type II secretory pathway component GspD/PulD (secretin)